MGDFVACGLLIKDITQALASSTGSISEVRALLETLTSLDRALLNFKAVYDQPNVLHTANLAFITNSILEAIGSECQKCHKLLDAFHTSIKPFTKSFALGKESSFTRHIRKITWLLHKDDVVAFERKLDGHVKILSFCTATLTG